MRHRGRESIPWRLSIHPPHWPVSKSRIVGWPLVRWSPWMPSPWPLWWKRPPRGTRSFKYFVNEIENIRRTTIVVTEWSGCYCHYHHGRGREGDCWVVISYRVKKRSRMFEHKNFPLNIYFYIYLYTLCRSKYFGITRTLVPPEPHRRPVSMLGRGIGSVPVSHHPVVDCNFATV